MIGRLCMSEGRNASIERAIATAEAPRPIRPRDTWHAQVSREAKNWQLEGQMHSSRRKMRRMYNAASQSARLRRGGGGGGRRGKGRGARVVERG